MINLNFDRLMAKQEPLCFELRCALFKNQKMGFDYINHPFICSPFHHEGLNAMVNAQLRAKVELFGQAVREGNWTLAIDILVEKPYRVEYLLRYQGQIPDEAYWPLLRSVWVGAENLWQYRKVMKRLFKGRTGNIREMFNEADLKLWDVLPGEVTIYRGCKSVNRVGWSWTLSHEKAHWFASRFSGRGIVRQVSIERKNAHCFITSRNEQEVVINPRFTRGAQDTL